MTTIILFFLTYFVYFCYTALAVKDLDDDDLNYQGYSFHAHTCVFRPLLLIRALFHVFIIYN